MSIFYKGLDDFKESAGYDIEGQWYPRVTSILSIKAKPGLYAYYASMPSFRAGQAMTERAAQEGTLVHNTVESILKKEAITIPSLIQPSVDALMEFLRNNDVNPLKIEERIVSTKHRYAGTIDVLAEVNGRVGVLDIKTSRSIYRDYGMQTAAYVEALSEDKNLPPLTSWILRLYQSKNCLLCGATLHEKGGNHKIRDHYTADRRNCPHQWSEMQGEYEFIEIPDFDHNIKAFLAAKELWEWEHRDFLQKISK